MRGCFREVAKPDQLKADNDFLSGVDTQSPRFAVSPASNTTP